VVNGLARVLVEEANKSLGDAPDELALDIEPMDPARIPDGPSWPRPGIAAAIGTVVGLVSSTMLAALLGWLNEPSQRSRPTSKIDAAEPN
jgi:hypothetical protein